jgi:DNA-binding IclR family transcriptional regulator
MRTVDAESAREGDGGLAAGDRGIEQSFGRAAALLTALAQAQRTGLRFTDLMNQTGFSKATLHRLLAALNQHGFVEIEQPGGRYFLGFQLGAWAAAVNSRHGLWERTAPIVRELSASVKETAYLSLRVREMAVCLVLQEGTAAIRALPLNQGDRSALGVGSAAAAILGAIDDDDEIRRILAAPDHQAYCARRQVSEEHIRKHLARTRKLGYAFVDDLNPDMIGIALALRGGAGQPLAALSVAAIHSRLRDTERRQAVLAEMRKAAAQLETLLSQIPPQLGQMGA